MLVGCSPISFTDFDPRCFKRILFEKHIVKSVGFFAACSQGGRHVVQVFLVVVNEPHRQIVLIRVGEVCEGIGGDIPSPSQLYSLGESQRTDESVAAQASR